MNLIDITVALTGRLAIVTPTIDMALENARYDPVAGRAYMRVTMMTGTADNPTMGTGFYRENGFFQVLLCYPANLGAGAAMLQAEFIRAAFKRGTSLAAGAGMVLVVNTPTISPAAQDDDRYYVPVRIRWQADVFDNS
jgi:hypothetical protein